MKAEFWVLIGAKKPWKHWIQKSISVRKSKPSKTLRDEVAIKMCVEIPDAIFERPALEAKITVSADNLAGPVITADVCDNIAEVLSEQLGLNMHVSSETIGDQALQQTGEP